MRIDEALFAHLSGNAGVSALVSTRIYPVVLPQGATLPAVTFMEVSAPKIRTMGGRLGGSPRFQITCWATTPSGARGVSDAILDALDHYSGTMGGGGGVNVLSSFEDNAQDDYDPEFKKFKRILDYIITYQE